MSRRAISVFLSVIFMTSFPLLVAAQEEESAAKPEAAANKEKAETPQDATHKVQQEALKSEVKLSGAFEPKKMESVVIHPEQWSAFTVVKAVPHGTKVSKGDQLVWLDTNSIEEKLADGKRSLKLSKMALELAELELKLAEKTTAMDLDMAERSKKISDEELLYFLKVDRPRQEQSAEYSLRNAQHSLEYAQEELDQLEKMYKADDLTEETEEIVLKRARHDVERAKFMLQSSELRTKRALETTIPREQESMEDAAKRAELTWTRTKASLPSQLEQKRLELEKQRISFERSVEQMEQLQKDLEAMTIKAPMDGYVYYGDCKRGKFGGIESAASQLRQGGKLSPHSVFMTVVSLRPLAIRVTVPEKELHQVKASLPATAIPTAFPEMKLNAKVVEVSQLPIGSENYDGELSVEIPADADGIVPGMTCKVTVVAFEKENALTVPASAVFENEADGQRNVVYVKNADGKPEKREVKIGYKTEKKWEVTEGLKAGEEILQKKPDAE